MRIISGKYGSRKIRTVGSIRGHRHIRTRPTSDRARETLFNVLANRIEFDATVCLDLFAGTGALGFECLSRGAELCHFVDSNGASIDLIRRTAEELECSGQIRFFRKDVISFLDENAGTYYDIILADPPYNYNSYEELVNRILKRKFGIFVLEHEKGISITEGGGGRFEILDKHAGLASFKIFVST